jgi:phosphomannomutase
MGIFKAYDIRGVYNSDFTADDVYRIGYFLPRLLECNSVLVGRDVRTSTPEVYEALLEGITAAGADVYTIGLATTPMVYYATAKHNFPASVQITASHNPKEYNGLKISKSGALPVGYESGLEELERMVAEEPVKQSTHQGTVHDYEIKEEYCAYMRQFAPESSLRVGVDCSNGMAALVIKDIMGSSPLYLYDTLDGTFPNHEPNPLLEENLIDLKELVTENDLDAGIIFDGDGDRVMFVDERGLFISPDVIIGVLAHYYLEKEAGYVLHDIRTSRAVAEYIRKRGGKPYMWKVGHAYAKVKLRELGAIYGGELAGHYYFRDFFHCDSGILASLLVLDVLEKMKGQGRNLSELIEEIVKYAYSGEINFRIENKLEAMEKLKSEFCNREQSTALYDFDGYRVEFEQWWFNVRPSNTEPYLRLVVEAETTDMLSEKLEEIKQVLNPYIQ